MKKIVLLIVLFSAKNWVMAQENTFPDNTNIYLVRHAEKEAGRDPQLTEVGKKRAGDLVRTLKDKKISRIYVTNYRRSWMTADSLRLQLGIDTVVYIPDTTGVGLLTKIKENNDFGKTILVVGHTNTIPHLIRVLGVDDYMTNDIPDEEFDNLYLVQYKKNKVYLEHKKYGAASR
ncbi:MAG: histidine phosphatase family protein [Ferruginibacter sp.]